MRLFEDRDGACVATMDASSREVLRSLVRDTAELLGGDLSAGGDPAGAAKGGTGAAEGGTGAAAAGMVAWAPDELPVPDDPALARLLPSARREDDDLAAEFRRLTEHDVRSSKITALRLVHDSLDGGDEIRVDPSRALDWAGGINDLRLVLAERMNIETAREAEVVTELAARPMPGEARLEALYNAARIYSLLGALQETLLQIVLGRASQ